MPMNLLPLVAIIDDDDTFARLMSTFLAEEGYRVITWNAEDGAIGVLRLEHPDAVIVDVRLGDDGSGLRVLERLQDDKMLSEVPVIVSSTDLDSLRTHELQIEEAHAAILPKPFDLDDLLHLIEASMYGEVRDG